MTAITQIDSSTPVAAPPASRPVHIADGKFLESLTAMMGIAPGTGTVPKPATKPTTIVDQPDGGKVPLAAPPRAILTAPTEVPIPIPIPKPGDPVATPPAIMPDAPGQPGVIAKPPVLIMDVKIEAPSVPHAVKTETGSIATKKPSRKSDADADLVAPVVAVAPPVVVAPVAPVVVPLSPAQTAVEKEAPAGNAPVVIFGARPAVGAAKPLARLAKKVDTTSGAAVADATAPKPDVPVPGQPPIVGAIHVAPVAVVHAALPTGGISTKVSETAIVSAKVAEGNAPVASTGSDLHTLVATANVLEVGVASGTHGWLRVRAELGQMGQVTASVMAASAGAAEGLHKELPAISAYLAGERVGVSSLVVNSASASAGAQDAALSAGPQPGGGQGQRGQGAQPGASQGANTRENDLPELDFGLPAMNLPLAIQANGSGGWLSVRV